MTDWIDWHRAYDSPTSSLTRRLDVVKQRLTDALDATPPGEARLLSLCAGSGRDVIEVLGSRGGTSPEVAVLVESDEMLAQRARTAAEAAGLSCIEVRHGDAGDCRTFEDVVPVNVLMLCGLFGNVDHADVEQVVFALPQIVIEGGFVIWTRGGSEPDRRPEVCEWFRTAGFKELAFDGDPEPYGVGIHRLLDLADPITTRPLPEPLFTFAL